MLSSRANSSEKLLFIPSSVRNKLRPWVVIHWSEKCRTKCNAPCSTDLVKTADAPFVREAVHRVRHRYLPQGYFLSGPWMLDSVVHVRTWKNNSHLLFNLMSLLNDWNFFGKFRVWFLVCRSAIMTCGFVRFLSLPRKILTSQTRSLLLPFTSFPIHQSYLFSHFTLLKW